MPPAVLADSEDEGDDIAEFECEDNVASSRGSRTKPEEVVKDALDGADERSTGSTGSHLVFPSSHFDFWLTMHQKSCGVRSKVPSEAS